MIRLPMFIALILSAPPAYARDDVPLSPIGMPFAPAAPNAVTPDHPLYRTITLTGIDLLPAKLGPAKRAAFVAALTDALDRLQMLSKDPATARFRLTPRWLNMDSPFRVSFSSRATARLAWQLERIDDGRTIFRREIATTAESRGGSASERKKGVERVALMTNIASVAACLDKAAYGRAAADCALTPNFTYHAPAPPLIMFVPR